MVDVVNYYRLAQGLYEHRIPALPAFLNYLVRFVSTAWIPAGAKISERVKSGYGGLGVVIHGRAQVIDGVVIVQNVTLAGKNGGGSDIGNNVVVKDVPTRSMVAGVPARIIRENIEISDYEQI